MVILKLVGIVIMVSAIAIGGAIYAKLHNLDKQIAREKEEGVYKSP